MINVANATAVFPLCFLCNSLTWITSACGEGTLSSHQQGIPLSHTCTHIRIAQTHTFSSSPLACGLSSLTHSHQHDDVIRVLKGDYSDITEAAAKLNLLASPCACDALQMCVCPCAVCKRLLRKLFSPQVFPFSHHLSFHF